MSPLKLPDRPPSFPGAPIIQRPLAEAFFAKLNGDTLLTNMLAAHKLIEAEKGIYTAQYVPLEAVMPYVHTYGQMGTNTGTKTSFGADVSKDIYAYTENDGNSTKLEDIMDRLYQLFCRQELTVAGYDYAFPTEVSLPFVVPTSVEFNGQAITVRLSLQATS